MVWLLPAGLPTRLRHRVAPHDIAFLLGSAAGSSLPFLGLAERLPLLKWAKTLSKVLLWSVLRDTVFLLGRRVTFLVIFLNARAKVSHRALVRPHRPLLASSSASTEPASTRRCRSTW